MSKNETKDPSQIPFEGVYVKCANISGKKVLIVIPDQGLEVGYLEYDKHESVDLGKYLQANILLLEDKKYSTNEVKFVSQPTPADVTKAKERVSVTLKKIAELEEELKKVKANSFKVNNEIPPVPEDLFINDKVWNLLAASLKLDKYTILLGPKGCGKTQVAQQLAIASNHKYVSFNMGAAFKPKQMFAGMLQAENGNTIFIESEFLKAFQATEPTLIFLDEITRTPQVATNYLMTILDRNQSYIYIEELGKRVFKGSGVRFISAGNVGSQYTDTRTLDGAFWDRFIKLPINYLLEKEELKLVMSRAPKANKTHIKVLVERANKCRKAEESGSITSGISTRQLIDMAHYLEIGFSVDDVFENIFLNNFINGNTNEITEVRTICQS